jgi:hypothetical protein
MGEAKRRRQQEQTGAGAARPQINQEHVARTVRQIVGAVTSSPAADCVLYALVGAELLRNLGVEAQAVAGSAIWRVGPGDGDVINYAPEAGGKVYAATTNPGAKAALFHSWIRLEPVGLEPARIVDLTTFQLAKKARELDAVDGGRTQVDFCPESLWVPESRHSGNPFDVAQSFDTGVFSYIRKPVVEAMVFHPELVHSAKAWGAAALLVYQQMGHGQSIDVKGLDEDGTISELDPDAPMRLVEVHGLDANGMVPDLDDEASTHRRSMRP